MEETEHAANHEERPAQAELSMAGAGGHKQWDNPDSESLDRTWECVAALYQIRVLGRQGTELHRPV